MMQINLVLGSSREKSLGRRVFNYLKNHRHDFEQQNAVHLNFLAVGDYQLPFFYEDVAPMNNQDRHLPAQQQAWLDDMEQASWYIFITPEYNHSFPAILKNGLDYLAFQTAKKPALIMSYSDNARAGQFGGVDLTPVLTRLGMTVLPPLVGIGNVQKNFNEAGEFLENAPSKDFYHQKLQQTVEKIAFYSRLFADNPFTPQS